MMKKHIDIVVGAAWLILLALLTFRMPVANLLNDPSHGFSAIDLVLSALFCLTGFASSFFAFVFSKKQLFLISLINILLFVLAMVLIIVSTASKNVGLFNFACYFVNLFCLVFGISSNMIAVMSAFLLLQIVSAVVFLVLLKLKKER
ncbi:MAG: hypothetical protein E7656_09230 [Ruminococcaceae bacterium]|nr:hypothetical protein [Oscillospiraceae bacterium]